MRKKYRLLAALMSLSLVFGSNGIAVMAAEIDQAPAAIEVEAEAPAAEEISVQEEAEVTEPAEEIGEGSEETPAENPEEETTEPEAPAEETPEEEIPEEEPEEVTEEETPEEVTEEENPEEEAPEDEEPAECICEEKCGEEGNEECPVCAEDPTACAAEDAEEEEVKEEEELLGEVEAPDGYFAVDDEGYLIHGPKYDPSYRSARVPAGAVYIGAGFFMGDTSLEKLEFASDSTLISIGENAFKNSVLTSITLPRSVTEIPASAFEGCAALTAVTARGVERVGNRAFYGCKVMTITALDKLTEVGDSAFENCAAMVALPTAVMSGVKSIGNAAFKSTGITAADFSGMNSYVEWGTNVFEGCTKLTTVVIPVNLTEIPKASFKGCTRLSSVTFKTNDIDGVIYGAGVIGASAFENCSGLTTIDIPACVYEIGSRAFAGTRLTTANIRYQYSNCYGEDLVIANDAFSGVSPLTMGGYVDEVEDYALSHNGITFKALSDTHTIVGKGTNATITLSAAKAKGGSNVTFTVSPATGYFLHEVYLKIGTSKDYKSVKPTAVETTGKVSFKFTMPESDIEVVAIAQKTAADVFNTSAAATTILSAWYAESNNSYFEISDMTGSGKTIKANVDIANPGYESALKISTKNAEAYSPWLFTYASNNQSVATVSPLGVIRAVGQGTAKITATLKNSGIVVVTLNVTVSNGALVITDMIPIYGKNGPESISTKPGYQPSTKSDEGLDVLIFNAKKLAGRSVTFPVSLLLGTEKDGTPVTLDGLTATTKWSSSDTAIASVASATSTDNTNTVTVKKGSSGQATITIKLTNSSTNDPDLKTITRKFLIKVIDTTPRLVESAVTVNVTSDLGAALHIREVYSQEIYAQKLTLVKKNAKGEWVNSGISALVEHDDEDDEVYHLIVPPSVLANAEKLSYTDTMFLRGYYDHEPGEEAIEFYIPIPSLTLVKTPLTTTITTSGKINLFYNSEASILLKGAFKVKAPVPGVRLEDAFVASNENIKLEKLENDPLFKNFDVEVDETDAKGQTLIISRSDIETLAMKDGKVVTSGYIFLYYEGYPKPLVKPISIATEDVAPALVLVDEELKSTATINARAAGKAVVSDFDLMLLDKKTKKIPLLLDESEGDTVRIDRSASTYGLFDAADEPVAINSDGGVDLEFLKTQAGKAVIKIKRHDWTKELTYTYTLNITEAMPKVKMSAATMTLNNAFSSQEGEILVTTATADGGVLADLDVVDVVASKSTYAADAYKLKSAIKTVVDDNGIGFINLELPSGISASTYTVKIRPEVEYPSTGKSIYLDLVSFKISVVNKAPVLKFKSSTFTLNARDEYVDSEIAATTFTVSNLPTGAVYKIDDSDMDIIPVKDGYDMVDVSFNGFEKDLLKGASEEFVALVKNQIVEVKLLDTPYKNFTYDYYLEGLKLVDEDGKTAAELGRVKIKVKGNYTNPKVTISQKGTMNPIDPLSVVALNVKVANLHSTISNLKIENEVDPVTKSYNDEIHFNIEPDELDPNQFFLTYNDEAETPLTAGSKYELHLSYTVDASGEEEYAKITVSPKSTLPKMTYSPKTGLIFVGQNRDKVVQIQMKRSIVKNMIMAEFDDVIFASTTPQNVKDAFEATIDEDGLITIRLVKPYLLTQDKDYVLNLSVKYKNHMLKANGTGVKVTVTVRK